MKKSDFWFMVIISAILAVLLVVVEIWFWAFSVPGEMAQGSIDDVMLCQHIIDSMPELEGASTSEVSFDKNGMYYVTYRGKMYIVDDAATQNNIEAFRHKYHDSCDYEQGIRNHYTFFSFFFAGVIAIIIGVCMTYAFSVRKELAKKGERIFGSFKIVT